MSNEAPALTIPERIDAPQHSIPSGGIRLDWRGHGSYSVGFPAGRSGAGVAGGRHGRCYRRAGAAQPRRNKLAAGLPALPDAWSAGSVTGLRARGGLTVDIQWSGGKPIEATLRPALSGEHFLRPAPGSRIREIRHRGGTLTLKPDADGARAPGAWARLPPRLRLRTVLPPVFGTTRRMLRDTKERKAAGRIVNTAARVTALQYSH